MGVLQGSVLSQVLLSVLQLVLQLPPPEVLLGFKGIERHQLSSAYFSN